VEKCGRVKQATDDNIIKNAIFRYTYIACLVLPVQLSISLTGLETGKQKFKPARSVLLCVRFLSSFLVVAAL
jgi:hypothetical protein